MSIFTPFDSKKVTRKTLSYLRETALQGALVLAKKWKTGTGRQYFTDIIGLYSTTVT